MVSGNLLNQLPAVARSPLALVGYVVVIMAWSFRAWLLIRPQRKAQHILAEYKSDKARTAALEQLVGKQPPRGLPDANLLEWVRIQATEQSRVMLLTAYVATLLAGVLTVALALYNGAGGPQSGAAASPSEPAPEIVNSTVTRDSVRRE